MTRVFITRPLPASAMKRLGELFDVATPKDDKPLSKKELIAQGAGATVLVPTLTDTIDAEVIDALKELKLIANFGAGVDHIDMKHAKARGILVTNTPSVLTEDTADVAMALLLAAPRRLSEGAQAIRDGSWQGWSPLYMLGHRVHGKTLGIVGLGRIGQAVARRAQGFGLSIHYHQRHRLHEQVEKELGAVYHKKLDDLLARSDFLSLHCPHTVETHHLIGSAQLQLMKPTSYLVNTARGALVDEKALIHALKEGIIAGAGLDVYEHAPNVPKELRELPNVVLLPHISSATIESREEMGQRVIINIKTFVDGHQPPDKVLLEEAS